MASKPRDSDGADYEYILDRSGDPVDSPEPGEVSRDQTGRRGQRKRRRAEADEDEDSEQVRLLANGQERERMRRINRALDELRRCLPPQFHIYHRRMSKIRTLRLAMAYISSLSALIREDNARRQDVYRQTIQQLPTPPATPALFPPGSVPGAFQSPAAGPYYPCMVPMSGTPVCDSHTSLYNTPLQTPPRRPFNPARLDFFATPSPGVYVSPGTIIARAMQTSIKGDNYNYNSNKFTPSLISGKKLSHPETVFSPLFGMRNTNEMDMSAMSATSDTYREDNEDTPAYTRHPGTLGNVWNDEACRVDTPGSQRFHCVSGRKAAAAERFTGATVAAIERS